VRKGEIDGAGEGMAREASVFLASKGMGIARRGI